MAIGSFNNPIQGANGALVISQLMSPNFVHGVSGWIIRQDGTAEFQDIIIPTGSGGAVVTFSGTAPTVHNVGDLWYDTVNDLQLHQWNGSSWVLYQYGATAIADNALTTQQFSPSVTARALGGITTTVAPSAPAMPTTGDIWINTSNGDQLNQWDGVAWGPISWDGTAVINAGTITATLIAANTITGENIAGGTITGGNIAGGTITSSQLNSNAINGFTINGVIINGNQINAADITIESGAGNSLLVYG